MAAAGLAEQDGTVVAARQQRPIPDLRQRGIRPWLRWAIAVSILFIGFAVYSNSFGGVFVYDDIVTLVEPPHLHRLTDFRRVFWGPPQSSVAGRPVASVSLAINYALGGLEPWGYHLVNIGLHLCCALLLLAVLERTCTKALCTPPGAASPLYLAGFSTLIWAIHPLLTESVTYVVQRTELLVSLFLLLTLYCSLRCWAGKHQLAWSIAAAAACALGMASKENMVCAPLLVWLFDRTLFSGSFREALRRHKWLYAGLATGWLVLFALNVSGPRSRSVGFGAEIGALDYLRTQASVVTYYLRLAFWPEPLCSSYQDWPIACSVSEVLPQAVLLLLLLGGSVWAIVRRSALGLAAATFFMLLAPTSSFIPIVTEIAAEKRMYLPLACVVVLAVFGLFALANVLGRRVRGGPRTAVLACTAVLMPVGFSLGKLTVDRNHAYDSNLKFWQDVVRKRPDNVEARTYLAMYLLQQGGLTGAERELRQVLIERPAFGPTLLNMGVLEFRRGNLKSSSDYLRACLRVNPDNIGAHYNFGVLSMKLGQATEALSHFQRTLELDPSLARSHSNIGLICVQQGRLLQAVDAFRRAIREDPDCVEAHLGLGFALIELGDRASAAAELTQAVRLRPDARVHARLADLLKAQGDSRGAEFHAKQARLLAATGSQSGTGVPATEPEVRLH